MPLIRRRIISLPFKHMTQMAPAVRAHDLCPLHPQRTIRVASHGSRNVVEVRRPAAARLELLLRSVQWRVAGCAGVDAAFRHVFVKFAGKGGLGSLLPEDAELICLRVRVAGGVGSWGGTYLWRERPAIRRRSFGPDRTSLERNWT